jgi:hypothetical protein
MNVDAREANWLLAHYFSANGVLRINAIAKHNKPEKNEIFLQHYFSLKYIKAYHLKFK